MKKLMTMIGALAAAFGLYAADVSLDASYISFEDSYPGCTDGQALDVTEPTDDGDYFWISTLEEAPAIAEFADGEVENLPYGPTGRREEFEALGDNANYLKLDTGKESLFRTLVDCGTGHTAVPVDVSAGPVFIDALVKFTAFEDQQTFTAEDGTKIAVWMQATEGEGAEGGETNLYVSAGYVDAPDVTVKNVKLVGDYAPDTWYRLTVKSVGSIFDAEQMEVYGFEDDRLGFVVYINGELASTEEALVAEIEADYLNATAKALAAEGQLFPSITAGLTLSGVGFKGMGSIDDLYTGAGEPFPVDVVTVIPPTSDEWTAVPEVEKAAPGAVINFTLTTKGDKLFKGNKSNTMVVTGTVGVDGTVTLDPEADIETGDAAAKIGTALYLTLNEAFNAAIDKDEIEMLDDVTLSERIFIGSAGGDKDITLDLAGKEITWDESVDNASGVFIVRSGSKLTVEDSSGTNAGKIDANGKAYAAIAITHGTYQDNAKTASLIVNGGTLVGFYQGIVGNGTRPNTYVEINGGVITATNTTAKDGNLAIFNPQQNSEVVINGGTLTGLWAAIEMRGGTLTVNNGTLTATAEAYAVNPNGSGSTTAGAAVAVAQHTTKGDIAVEIKGGTLTGVKAVSVANPQGNTTDNVAVTLGGATYVGDLAFSADGNATVTDNDSGLAAPAGYKWKGGVLAKIELVTLTIKQVDNCTIVVSNATAAVDSGTTFDKDDETKLTVYRTPAEGYVLDGFGPTEEITMSDDVEVTAAVKETQKEAVKPGEPVGLGNPGSMTLEEAKAAAEKLTIVIDQADIDAGLTVDAVTVKVELNNGAYQAVLEPKEAPVVDDSVALEVTTENFGATVENPVPGVYYGFVATETLGTAFEAVGEYVRATSADEKLTLTAPKGKGNACFYKLNAALRPPKTTPVE